MERGEPDVPEFDGAASFEFDEALDIVAGDDPARTTVSVQGFWDDFTYVWKVDLDGHFFALHEALACMFATR